MIRCEQNLPTMYEFGGVVSSLVVDCKVGSYSFLKFLIISACLCILSGCRYLDIDPPDTSSCKIHTYINAHVVDYIRRQYGSRSPVRVAVMPFDVPESFAFQGTASVNYGRTLASKFQRAFLQTEELSIVELFDRDNWPGKSDEFFAGNYGAMKLARDAGYDVVVLGRMNDIVDGRNLAVNVKIIDLNTSITLWFGEITAYTHEKLIREAMSKAGVSKEKHEDFQFEERTDELANCAAESAIVDLVLP